MTLSSDDAQRLVEGRHNDPFSVLGLHEVGGKLTVRAFVPVADFVAAVDPKTGKQIAELKPVAGAEGLFA
ncbi:MAG: hypothetical protein AAGF27_09005, partial [Pseudomonadota bacterium]